MVIFRGYVVRIYPTQKQIDLIWKHIHACRFIWNYMLAWQQENYANGRKRVSAYAMENQLTPLKHQPEYAWLYEVSNSSLCNVCVDLAEAYQNFFNGVTNHPKFKSRKREKTSYPVRTDHGFYFAKGKLVIAKVGKIKYKSDFTFKEGRDQKFYNVRLSYRNGKYFVSFSVECESQAPALTDDSMGIDLGIKELAVAAYGDKQIVFNNINKSKKVRDIERRLRHVHRVVSRKYEASKKRTGKYKKTNNIFRQENEMRRLYARLKGIRENYIHQTTHELISMLPSKVVMEDLNIAGLMKNKHVRKAIGDQCWHEFIRQMRYKCLWSGIPFYQVNRYYPSSKTCSMCGAINHDLKLSDRTFTCPICGCIIDRDYNAAINLSRYTGQLNGL